MKTRSIDTMFDDPVCPPKSNRKAQAEDFEFMRGIGFPPDRVTPSLRAKYLAFLKQHAAVGLKSKLPNAAIDYKLQKHWHPFAARLQQVLSEMQEGQFLVLTLKETNRFVQFAAQGALGMRVEATSNHFLSGQDKLDSKKAAALVALGWNPPTGTPKQSTPESDPEGSPNFYLDIPNPIDFSKLAVMAIRTLSDVFGVAHDGFLQCAAYDCAGNTIALPEGSVALAHRCAATG